MSESPKSKRDEYIASIAETIIQQLEAGTAPWVRPWKPGELQAPHNPVSGARYSGSNLVRLMMSNRPDPRWMTYKQAQSIGAQVNKGESGVTLEFWIQSEKVKKRDDKGKVIMGPDGEPEMETIKLERPRMVIFTVFNADQMHGLPPRIIEAPEHEWERHARAEKILKQSGAKITHGGNRAFYSPERDHIYLPDPGQFPTGDAYYATALHELGHWTGHPTRLNRELMNKRGGEEYAREELRAEISSMMVSLELNLGHDPGQHAAYVESWVQILKDQPQEIFHACRDAEKIKTMVMGFENDKTLEKEKEAEREGSELER